MATPAKVTKTEGKNNHDTADEQAGEFETPTIRLRLRKYVCVCRCLVRVFGDFYVLRKCVYEHHACFRHVQLCLLFPLSYNVRLISKLHRVPCFSWL